MPRRIVTVRGESSTKKDARRLRLAALPGGLVHARIHNPPNTSGMECVLGRDDLDRLAASGPSSGTNVPAVDRSATAQLAVRPNGDAYLWIFTPGDEGWDILVSQAQLARVLGELIRLEA